MGERGSLNKPHRQSLTLLFQMRLKTFAKNSNEKQCYDLSWGGVREDQRELPASAIFSNAFKLKYLLYQGAVLWGNVF